MRLANESRFGLAGYVWTEGLGRAHRVAQAMRTGTIWVNTPMVRDLRSAFGGYKESGVGRRGRTRLRGDVYRDQDGDDPGGRAPDPQTGGSDG